MNIEMLPRGGTRGPAEATNQKGPPNSTFTASAGNSSSSSPSSEEAVVAAEATEATAHSTDSFPRSPAWRVATRRYLFPTTHRAWLVAQGEPAPRGDMRRHDWFEHAATAVLAVAVLTLALYTPLKPRLPEWVTDVQRLAAAVSVIELLLRVAAMGVRYMCKPLRALDSLVVLAAAAGVVLGAIGIETKLFSLTGLRVFRLLRTMRNMKWGPSMSILLASVGRVLLRLFDVSLLLGFFVLLYSFAGLDAFAGLFEYRCVSLAHGDPNVTAAARHFRSLEPTLHVDFGESASFSSLAPPPPDATSLFSSSRHVPSSVQGLLGHLATLLRAAGLQMGPRDNGTNVTVVAASVLLTRTADFVCGGDFDTIARAALAIDRVALERQFPGSESVEGADDDRVGVSARTLEGAVLRRVVASPALVAAARAFRTAFVAGNHSVSTLACTPQQMCSAAAARSLSTTTLGAAAGYRCPYGYRCADRGMTTVDDATFVSFDNLALAALNVFTSMTQELWYTLGYAANDTIGSWLSGLYFSSLIVVGGYLIVAVFVALVAVEFEKAKREVRLRKAGLQRCAVSGFIDGVKQQQQQQQSSATTTNRTGRNDNDATAGSAVLDAIRDAEATLLSHRLTYRRTGMQRVHERLNYQLERADLALAPLRLRVQRHVTERVWFAIVAPSCIFFNLAVLASSYEGMTERHIRAIETINNIMNFVFLAETVFRILGEELRSFLCSPLHIVDTIVVLIGWVEAPLGLRFLRTLRMVRVVSSLEIIPGVYRWVVFVKAALLGSPTVLLILFMLLFLFAIAGMQFLGGQFCGLVNPYEAVSNPINIDNTVASCPGRPRTTFDTFSQAMISTFSILIGDDWNSAMYNAMQANVRWGGARWWSAFGALAFVAYYFLSNFVLFNVLTGVMLSSNQQQQDLQEPQEEAEDDGHYDAMTETGTLIDFGGSSTDRPTPDATHSSVAAPLLPPRAARSEGERAEGGERTENGEAGASLDARARRRRRAATALHRLQRRQTLAEEVEDAAFVLQGGRNPVQPVAVALPGTTTAADAADAAAAVPAGTSSLPNGSRGLATQQAVGAAAAGVVFATSRAFAVASGAANRIIVATHDAILGDVELADAHRTVGGGGSSGDMTASTGGAEATPTTATEQSTFGRFASMFRKYLRVGLEHRVFSAISTSAVIVGSFSLALTDQWEPPDRPWARASDYINFATLLFFTLEVLAQIAAHGLFWSRGSFLRRDPWNVFEFLLTLLGALTAFVVQPLAAHPDVVSQLYAFQMLRPLCMVRRSPSMRLVLNALVRAVVGLRYVVAAVLLGSFAYGVCGVMLMKGTMSSCVGPDRSDFFFVEAVSPLRAATNASGNESAWSNATSLWTTRTVLYSSLDRASCVRGGGRWTPAFNNFDDLGSALFSLYVTSTMEGWLDVMRPAMDFSGTDQAPVTNARPLIAFYFVLFVFTMFFVVNNIFTTVLIDAYNREKRTASSQLSLALARERNGWLLSNRRLMRCVPTTAKRKQGRSQQRTTEAAGVGAGADVNGLLALPHNPASRHSSGSGFSARVRAARLTLRPIVRSERFMAVSLFLSFASLVFVAASTSLPINLAVPISAVFATLFAVEAALKIFGETFPVYIAAYWNRLDFFVALTSVIAVGLLAADNSSRALLMLRSLRLLRLSRLLKGRSVVGSLLVNVGRALLSLGGVVAVVFLVLVVFATMGRMLFGRVVWTPFSPNGINHNVNFAHLGPSLNFLLRLSSGGNWVPLLAALRSDAPGCDRNLGDCGPASPAPELFLVSFIVLSTYVLRNLLVAVMLDAFSAAAENRGLSKTEAVALVAAWLRFDTARTMTLPALDLLPFLRAIPASSPLGLNALPPADRVARERRVLAMLRIRSLRHRRVGFGNVVDVLCRVAYSGPTPPADLRPLAHTIPEERRAELADEATGRRPLDAAARFWIDRCRSADDGGARAGGGSLRRRLDSDAELSRLNAAMLLLAAWRRRRRGASVVADVVARAVDAAAARRVLAEVGALGGEEVGFLARLLDVSSPDDASEGVSDTQSAANNDADDYGDGGAWQVGMVAGTDYAPVTGLLTGVVAADNGRVSPLAPPTRAATPKVAVAMSVPTPTRLSPVIDANDL